MVIYLVFLIARPRFLPAPAGPPPPGLLRVGLLCECARPWVIGVLECARTRATLTICQSRLSCAQTHALLEDDRLHWQDRQGGLGLHALIRRHLARALDAGRRLHEGLRSRSGSSSP